MTVTSIVASPLSTISQSHPLPFSSLLFSSLLFSSLLFSFSLASPLLASPRLASPRLASPRVASPRLASPQVEYAIEAINNAGTLVGLLTDNGLVLASERKVTTTLLQPPKTSEKTYKIADHVWCSVAGLTSDANILINEARLKAGRYFYQYQEPIPVEQLVTHVSDHCQAYTQYGGLRPFGVSFLFAGYDSEHGFQLYQTDPSGNYSGWRATVVGANNAAGKTVLKSEYKKKEEDADEDAEVPPPTLNEGLKLAVKVLNKTMDNTVGSKEKMEIFVLERDGDGDNLKARTLTEKEKESVLSEVEAEAKDAGDK